MKRFKALKMTSGNHCVYLSAVDSEKAPIALRNAGLEAIWRETTTQ